LADTPAYSSSPACFGKKVNEIYYEKGIHGRSASFLFFLSLDPIPSINARNP
jgi:hypothetical protein